MILTPRCWPYVAGPGVAAVDPATLDLTSLQRDFAGGANWLGTASLGTSGLHKEVAFTTMPEVSAELLNGHAGAVYRKSDRNTKTALVSTSAAVLMESLVANSAYCVSFLVDVLGPGYNTAGMLAYQRCAMLAADAHWGWGFSSAASVRGACDLSYEAPANRIVRSAGHFVNDGFAVGMAPYSRRTLLNNGRLPVITALSPTVMDFGAGTPAIVNETVLSAADPCLSAGTTVFSVFNYDGSTFPAQRYECSPGLHWVVCQHVAAGLIEVYIDGERATSISGTDVLADHAGASGVQAQSNSNYTTDRLNAILYERFTLQRGLTAEELEGVGAFYAETYAPTYADPYGGP